MYIGKLPKVQENLRTAIKEWRSTLECSSQSSSKNTNVPGVIICLRCYRRRSVIVSCFVFLQIPSVRLRPARFATIELWYEACWISWKLWHHRVMIRSMLNLMETMRSLILWGVTGERPATCSCEQSMALMKSTWHLDAGAIGLNSSLFHRSLKRSRRSVNQMASKC